jgi:phage-related protein
VILKFFTRANGRTPVREEINKLNIEERARIWGSLECVEKIGTECHRVEFRQIKNKLWEIKIKGITGTYRIFYVMLDRNTMLFLHFYTKKSQKAPRNEIEIAERRMKEIK